MNSVEALTDRPTSDPSENGIMEGTGLPRSQAANVETRAHLLHHGLRHLRSAGGGMPSGVTR
jgi:hypothetical protein